MASRLATAMRILERALPYLKASVDDDGGPAIELSAEDSPILEPYVGKMLVSYVVDDESSLRFVTERERRTMGVSEQELRRAALANFAAKISVDGVRIAPAGRIFAVLFDGNFEATLMLWDDLWPYLHEQLGPELLAVAPARDILAVAAVAEVNELRQVVERAWPNGDHLLTPEVFRRAHGAWSLHRPA
jgi:hypothetical protein